MLSKQATITLTASADPSGVGVTIDDLQQFVDALLRLEDVKSIELYEGEIVAVGTEAPIVPARQFMTINSMPVPRALS